MWLLTLESFHEMKTHRTAIRSLRSKKELICKRLEMIRQVSSADWLRGWRRDAHLNIRRQHFCVPICDKHQHPQRVNVTAGLTCFGLMDVRANTNSFAFRGMKTKFRSRLLRAQRLNLSASKNLLVWCWHKTRSKHFIIIKYHSFLNHAVFFLYQPPFSWKASSVWTYLKGCFDCEHVYFFHSSRLFVQITELKTKQLFPCYVLLTKSKQSSNQFQRLAFFKTHF